MSEGEVITDVDVTALDMSDGTDVSDSFIDQSTDPPSILTSEDAASQWVDFRVINGTAGKKYLVEVEVTTDLNQVLEGYVEFTVKDDRR